MDRIDQPVFSAGQNAPVIVIDPGHGGMDGGATGTVLMEKDVNLAISQRLSLLLHLFGVENKLTREEDVSLDYDPGSTIRSNKNADLHARLRIAQQTENAVFISIHLNKFEQSQYKGAQTFYSVGNPGGKDLALLVQRLLRDDLDPSNNREAKAADSRIFLMKNLTCPAVIVECGFLSNPEDQVALATEDYQKKIARAIAAGTVGYLCGITIQNGAVS